MAGCLPSGLPPQAVLRVRHRAGDSSLSTPKLSVQSRSQCSTALRAAAGKKAGQEEGDENE